MNRMARIVRSPDGQSVELPEGYRFDTDDVRITRHGHRVILEPGGAIDDDTGLPISTLRALIQEGFDSSASEPLGMEAVKVRARREARR